MSPKKSDASLITVLGYTLPRLHKGKKWYVDFYATDPETKEKKRKKYYIPMTLKSRERTLTAASIIESLTLKLRGGWNPWTLNENVRCTKELTLVFEQYLKNLSSQYRATSIHNYRSRLNMLRKYLTTLATPPQYVFQLERPIFIGFLDWITEKGNNSRTRNNYRGWLSSFCDFLKERNYIEENPITEIKKTREKPKIRQPLTEMQLKTLFSHLMATDRHFLLACLMEYYTFIRPNELRSIKLSDFSLKEMTVFVAGEISKNRKDYKVSLNDEIVKLMIDLKTFESPTDYYLFGNDFRPSAEKGYSDQFNRRWHKVRKELGWPDDLKFYSLKDSGIRDLSNAAGVVVARDQARHSDISTTNRYLQGRDKTAPEAAKHFKGSLSQ